FSAGVLVIGVFVGSRAHLAALVGAAIGFAYYLVQRMPVVSVAGAPSIAAEERVVRTATRNVARVTAMKKALSTASQADIDRLIAAAEREIVRGVNICAPVDYKP